MNKVIAAYWLSPTQRALRAQVVTPAAKPQRRPFSPPKVHHQPGSELALKTARIFHFTGSNTPYESHE
ncbi:hypothetical protein B9Z39_12885 [Limnohabitans sp. JirII-29]|nr:hypothetical protein B9Z39_12885 [Limnohabitans sp. JirII-29]